MSGHLIINVDDFGFTQGVNEAVWELAQLGTISATNLMANMPYVKDGVNLARAFPQLSIGLHICLTQGKPVLPPSEVPSLVDSGGNFLSLGALRKKRRGISPTEIRKEIEAQVSIARNLLGNRLDHWNSHQGVHRFQPFLQIISDVCYTHNIPWMRSHRHYFIDPTDQRLRLVHPNFANLHKFGVKRVLTELYYTRMVSQLSRQFSLPSGILAINKGDTRHTLEAVINHTLPNGIWEIACHPATTTRELTQTTMLESRIQEFHLLSSEPFQSALREQPTKLAGFVKAHEATIIGD